MTSAQDAERRPTVPLFSVSFQRQDPIPGVSASPIIRLPSQCTGDGTIFLTMVDRPLDFPPKWSVFSVSLSGKAHTFPLSQVPELYDLREDDHYPGDSEVVFLVYAARENKRSEQKVITDRGQAEITRNAAEHHSYVVTFDREGNYKKTVQVDAGFRPMRVGIFSTGMFLAYGFDESDHSAKLALLKEDGSLLKFLELPAGSSPDSAMSDGSGKQRGASQLNPVQFVRDGDAIVIVQNKTNLPLVEVNEAGALRVIRPKLRSDLQISMLIPGDPGHLLARVGGKEEGSVYEVSSSDGSILRRFLLGREWMGGQVACMHEGKFLSFDQAGGVLAPVIGTPALFENAEGAASSNNSR